MKVKLDWGNKMCDQKGTETYICIFRDGDRCNKPRNKIPYNYGYCPHQIWEVEEPSLEVK